MLSSLGPAPRTFARLVHGALLSLLIVGISLSSTEENSGFALKVRIQNSHSMQDAANNMSEEGTHLSGVLAIDGLCYPSSSNLCHPLGVSDSSSSCREHEDDSAPCSGPTSESPPSGSRSGPGLGAPSPGNPSLSSGRSHHSHLLARPWTYLRIFPRASSERSASNPAPRPGTVGFKQSAANS